MPARAFGRGKIVSLPPSRGTAYEQTLQGVAHYQAELLWTMLNHAGCYSPVAHLPCYRRFRGIAYGGAAPQTACESVASVDREQGWRRRRPASRSPRRPRMPSPGGSDDFADRGHDRKHPANTNKRMADTGVDPEDERHECAAGDRGCEQRGRGCDYPLRSANWNVRVVCHAHRHGW